MLPPIFDKDTEIMVFGSYPGEESMRKREYYGNPHNHFWRIMSELLGEKLVEMAYEERLHVLLKHKVGLWDAWESVERKGSLDSAIRDAKMNDFSLLRKAPKLRLVAFNGKSSGKAKDAVEALGYRTVILPSSSAANAIPLGEKKRIWGSSLGL